MVAELELLDGRGFAPLSITPFRGAEIFTALADDGDAPGPELDGRLLSFWGHGSEIGQRPPIASPPCQPYSLLGGAPSRKNASVAIVEASM
jgi:hypothetical protein